jgi:hypothetical protein
MGRYSMSQTKFEEQLQQFFPEIYRIHQVGKYDKYVWDVFDKMMEMVDSNEYGEIRITYQCGKINLVSKTTNTTANRTGTPLKTFPGVIK